MKVVFCKDDFHIIFFFFFFEKTGENCKVGDIVSGPVSVWPLEWDISVPVNTGVPFRVYCKYIYIYIYIYICTHF
jgi:hypothetical protein